ncbi:hypothetical protein [Peribacillus sp. NPDC096448]|uniref:hypothetical protein n=1 Tax=Peribacillus sp. NPDC096448 TaxID=3364395 RepID=UPI003828BF2E
MIVLYHVILQVTGALAEDRSCLYGQLFLMEPSGQDSSLIIMSLEHDFHLISKATDKHQFYKRTKRSLI